jgi:hypothetical protein
MGKRTRRTVTRKRRNAAEVKLAETLPARVVTPTMPLPAGAQGTLSSAAAPQRLGVQSSARGTSGTRLYAGFFNEEYLPELRGMAAADLYDKMRRNDGQVQMVTSSVINPIKAATWEVEPGDEGSDYERHAEFIDHILFRDLGKPFKKWLSEALTCIIHGYSLFEVVHKVVQNHPKFGSYVGIASLGFRSQRTVYRWRLDPATGTLLGVTQLSQGDLQRYLEIPGEFLLHFALDQEGDNYEGISKLRTCYGPWLRKQTYLKLLAIGMEKSAVPTPKVVVPKGLQDTPEYNNLIEALENYTSSESAWITIPAGDWALDFVKNDFDPSKVITSIEFEDKQMTRAFLANFLELGQTGGGGSYSLALNQSDFFESAIEFIADAIADPINERLIPQLIQMNFGPQESYPRLKHSGIRDKIGLEFGNLMKALAETQIIKPDDKLEEHIRRRMKLPEMSLIGQRSVKAPSQQTGQDLVPEAAGALPPQGPVGLSEVHLTEKPRAVKLIENGRDELVPIMRQNLSEIGDALVGDIMRAVKKARPAERPSARRGISAGGGTAYKSALSAALGSIATRAIKGARAEVPKKRNVKLHDELSGIRLDEFDKLPARVQKKIASQVELTAGAHISDLEKAIGFAFDHSEGSTDSDAILEQDLRDAAERVVESAGVQTGASNSAALIVNEARNAFFFEPDVLEGIASFTFVNPDPVSPICQDLAGQTFDANDPEAQRYFPPLHHNCKSTWVPNLVGRNEPDVTGLKPSSSALEKYITLSARKRPLSKRRIAR